MINGHTAQQNQVQNMFHSVQLNVNNPHFLIMQGRITKVLNMKPPEILSMIEEAAGTRMFETKKQAAVKTIEKKQLKVDEITKCINEEITPTLENLRTERQDYHAWQANNTEYERLERFCVAHEFQDAQERADASESTKQEMVSGLKDLEATHNAKSAEAADCSSKVADIERLRGGEMEGDLQQLKATETELSKQVVKTNTHVNNQKESLKEEQDSLTSLEKQTESINTQIVTKSAALKKCEEELVEKEAEAHAAEEAYATTREKYQNACAGVTDETNSELLSLPEQVGAWEKREREAQSQVQQCQQRLTHSCNQLKELQKSSKQQSQSHSSTLKEIEKLNTEIAQCEAKLQKIDQQQKQLSATVAAGSDAPSTTAVVDEQALRSRASELQQTSARLRDEVDSLTASLEARLAFDFRDPERGFDRSRVKGLVARLVKVQDREAATALEIAAGAKLYQVVVDTEQTGKLLLQKGGLRKRVTILPLNKINSRCTEPAKLQRARSVATAMGGTAQLALELVGFEDELKKAMEYVFGSAIICNSPEIAKAIAFDKQIRNRTVTLEGDVYDPSGTLTGGAKSQIGVLLTKIDALATAQDRLQQADDELKTISSQLGALEKLWAAARELQAELELKQHELKLCQEKMADSDFSQSMNQINEIQVQIDTMEKVHKNFLFPTILISLRKSGMYALLHVCWQYALFAVLFTI